MAKILIEPSKAKSVLSLEYSLEKALKSMSNEVDGIRGGLRYKISGQEQIAARLRDVVSQLTKESAATGTMRTGLEEIIARYEQTENGNRDRAVADKTSVQQGGGTGSASSGSADDEGETSIWDSFLPMDKEMWQKMLKLLQPIPPGPFTPFIPFVLDILPLLSDREFKVENKNEVKVDLKDANDWSDGKEKIGEGKVYYKDLKTGEITQVDPNDEKAMEAFKEHNKGSIPVDFTLASVGVSGSAALFDGDFGDDWGWGGTDGNVSVLKLEGHADAYLGLGAVGAEVGTSITAFSAEEKVYLGTEDTNVYAEFGTVVGKAEAKAEVSAGIVDKSGNFNPSLYAGASAEAIAGEVTGKVGAEFAGVDVGLEAGLNYGIGAHANVGLHDGKLSVDIGATLGIGASLKFDVDFSGAIDAAAEKAENIWSGVKNLFSW